MWKQVGTTGAIVISVLLMVFIAIAMVKRKKMVKQEEGVGSKVLELGEVAEPRQETCYGCPPEGPDVALDLDPHRCDGDQCSIDRN
jgi:hypothetical protein